MQDNSKFISSREWLEADGLGGFASGSSTGIRTRRYHALLLTATNPPTGRMVLVNGFDAWVETPNGTFSLSSQCYAPNVIGGDGAQRIEAFGWEPWPHWIYKLEDGTRIELEIFVVKGEPMTCGAMVDEMLAKKLWTTDGKTPAATIYSAILRECAKKGAQSRFKKTDRGLFTFNGK